MVKNASKMAEVFRKHCPNILDPINLAWFVNSTKLTAQVKILRSRGYTDEQIYEIIKPTCNTLIEILNEMEARKSGET